MSRRDGDLPIRVIARGRWRRVVAEDRGQDVSHLSYGPVPMRVGAAGPLSMAGIAGVGTEPQYRRAGLARRVLAHAIEEIRAAGHSCAGLHTGSDIVAHRLYRRFGFVDTQAPAAAQKLLDPAQYVVNRFSSLLRGDDVRPETLSWRCTLRLHLPPHAPVLLRLHHGKVHLQEPPPEKVDLALTVSSAIFDQIFRNQCSCDFARAAKLVQWEGEEAHWQHLVAAIEAKREMASEGSL